MKSCLVLFCLTFLCLTNSTYSLLLEKQNNLSDLLDIAENLNIKDSLISDNTTKETNTATVNDTDYINLYPARIEQQDFMYADNFRCTIDGNLPLKNTEINSLRLGIFGGALTGFMVYQHIYQVNTIWSKNVGFRFIEDGNYALYSDKIGHFYGAYFSGYVYTNMLMWSGFSNETSVLTGALMGIAYSTYVEIMDGYADKWGFSPTDFYSDAGGFGFLLLQHYVPWFQNITPKFMYIPSEWHGEKRRSPSEFFIDDYSSQTFYFTLNVYNILPENLKKYWVPWLQLTLGYAARNLSNPLDPKSDYDPKYSTIYYPSVAGSPRFIIGLDYDFVKMLPDGIPLWNWIRQTLNYLKFPAPAIEISERGTRFLLMYPFIPF